MDYMHRILWLLFALSISMENGERMYNIVEIEAYESEQDCNRQKYLNRQQLKDDPLILAIDCAQIADI